MPDFENKGKELQFWSVTGEVLGHTTFPKHICLVAVEAPHIQLIR